MRLILVYQLNSYFRAMLNYVFIYLGFTVGNFLTYLFSAFNAIRFAIF